MVIPFGLKNAPAIFSRIVVSPFKGFIHKFIEFYFDDWTMFGLLRDHIESLHMMLAHCRLYQIALKSKKCILCALFVVLLCHFVCRSGILLNPAKIVIILDLPPPTSVTQLRSVLGHIGYYRNFIRGHAEITTPMEKLLKKYAMLRWTPTCQEILDKLKNKMATKTILVFPD